jgi:hypothetical protein
MSSGLKLNLFKVRSVAERQWELEGDLGEKYTRKLEKYQGVLNSAMASGKLGPTQMGTIKELYEDAFADPTLKTDLLRVLNDAMGAIKKAQAQHKLEVDQSSQRAIAALQSSFTLGT